MSASTPAFSSEGPNDSAGPYNAMVYIIQSVLAGMQSASLVKVIACTNDGGVSAVGTVDVQVLTNLQSANGVAIPHGTIYGLPYFRVQGGDTAIIIDPKPGDVGAAVFCSRDISSVVAANLGHANAIAANPGSSRTFDWSDGLYFGGMLNGVPSRFIQFDDAGNIVMRTPTGKLNLNGTTVDANGNIVVKPGSTITDGQGVVVETHKHNPGTYVAGATPVTGKSDVPTT